MDAVSMLNTMSFYCQPILPLVYDESMSYYETLCKVVGQLNNTGETVNKLNEGLTTEIADRQAGDAALDARIKELESTSSKLHFIKVDTLGHLLTAGVTREKLSQWVQNGDLIVMLYAPDEQENSWAIATNYRCMGATGADTMQLSFYAPISITNNAGKSGSDIAQEVVAISLPVGELTDQWAVRHITSTIPNTNADGFVNLTATVSDAGAVTCDVEPGAIVEALRNYFSGTNQFAVAVNARLNYGGKQYHSSAATVKADTSGTGNIRITFENYYDGVRAENGVRQTVNTTVFLVGDVKNNAWSVETIDYKTFDFSRYEGFQFTRGANNVIITNDESTPNAVYAQYHSDTSGKLYQNLPTRLIDSVDGAEYWNGTFDIYGGKHMTFTFVTSNYATASDKMLVRVIELSADVGTTAWKYGVKEFTLPLSGGGATTYVDFWATGQSEVYDNDLKAWTIALETNQTFDAIFDLISSGANVVARLYKDATKAELVAKSLEANLSGDKTLGTINFLFMGAATGVAFGFPTIADAIWVTKTSTATSAYALYKWCALPVPAGDSSDNGKVPTVNGTAWELKGQPSKPLYITIDVANIDERIYTLTDGNKTYTVEEIYAAKENGTPVFIAPADIGAYFQVLDFSFSNTAFKAFFLNVVRRTDMSYGRLTISTVGGQTKGTYNASGFLGAPASGHNGKFLKMKQDGSGIEYADGFKYFIYDARTTSAEMTPAEVKAFITANPQTPIFMLIAGIDTRTRPIWAVQQSWANDTVVFVSTSITRTTGVQEYKLVKAASDTTWGAISGGRLVTDDTPSVANPTFAEDIDGHAEIVLGVGQDSSASNENLPYLATGDYPKHTIDGMTWSDLRLYNGVFAYRDVSVGSIYNKLLDGTMLPDIDFVLSNAVLIGTVEGEITNYNNDYYNIIKEEISRNRGNIWLSFNGETIRLASWKQAGSDTYALTFFGTGAAAQPVKYVVTASASAATLTVTGS